MKSQRILIVRACFVIIIIISFPIIIWPPIPEPDCPQCLAANFGRGLGLLTLGLAALGLFQLRGVNAVAQERF